MINNHINEESSEVDNETSLLSSFMVVCNVNGLTRVCGGLYLH